MRVLFLCINFRYYRSGVSGGPFFLCRVLSVFIFQKFT